MSNSNEDLDRPIWGVKQIAKIVDRTERQTFHMLQSGQLPASKIGDRWVSTRRRLLAPIMGNVA